MSRALLCFQFYTQQLTFWSETYAQCFCKTEAAIESAQRGKHFSYQSDYSNRAASRSDVVIQYS